MYENNKVDAFRLRGVSNYKNIREINFTPVKKVKVTKCYTKGQWRFWKWLGLIPLIPYKVKNDLFKKEDTSGFHTLEEIKNDIWDYSFIKGEEIYIKAKVRIWYISETSSETITFERNEDALNYIDDLKIKCKESGNQLK